MMKYLAKPRFNLGDVIFLLSALALLDAGRTCEAVALTIVGAVALTYLDDYHG